MSLETDSLAQITTTTQRSTPQSHEDFKEFDSHRNSFAHRLSGLWETAEWWPAECVSLLTSCAALSTIVVLFAVFDGSEIPEWHYGITLNTVVSVLATITTFTILSPVASAMGQVKWIWFRHRRQQLDDFRLLDLASRGVTGSIQVLFKRCGGILAALGASLMLLILAINPFIQQIITYQSEPVLYGYATLPAARIYNTSAQSIFTAEVTIKASVYDALFSTGRQIYNVTPSCTTGNCSWSPYHTLGVCGACANVTSYLQDEWDQHPYVFNWTYHVLPNGWNFSIEETLSMTNTYQTTWWDNSSSYDTVAFSNAGSVLLDIFVGFNRQATECILQWCVMELESVQRNGIYEEIITDICSNNTGAALTHFDQTPVKQPAGGDLAVGPEAWYVNITYPNSTETYHVSWTSQYYLSLFLGSLFAGNVVPGMDDSNEESYSSDFMQPLYQRLSPGTWEYDTAPEAFATIEEFIANIASAMTLNIRTRANAGLEVLGTSWRNITVVRIRWFWIILPFALLILVLLFVTLTIRRTKKSGLQPWKNNALAVLFHGLDSETRDTLGILSRVDTMEELAENLEVELLLHNQCLLFSKTE